MNAPPNHPGKNDRNNGEIKLHGTSICPGFSIGRIHVVDADISIPQNRVAADRDNEQVADYNDPTNPAFLWLLEFSLAEAGKTGRENDLAICGEIASNLEMIPRLLRMGYRSFSIAPVVADPFRRLCAEETIR